MTGIPMVKTLYIKWDTPLSPKIYKEVGMIMTEILRYIYNVEHADDEGAVLYLIVNKDQEDEIKELRSHFLYIDVWFEDEDQEKLKQERLMRWAKAKGLRK
jgi:rRNA maturation protein Rpf1